MAWFVGIVLLTVSFSLLLARYGVLIGPEIQRWIETAILADGNLFDPQAKYALVITWLQGPALITGILEELPWGGATAHIFEFVVFAGLFLWKQHQQKINS